MRLCRFTTGRFTQGRLGVVQGSSVRDVTSALDVLPSYRYPLPNHDPLIANLPAVTARVCELMQTPPAVPLDTFLLDAVSLLSPVANPGKIVAAPVNYAAHLEEYKVDAALHQNKFGMTIQSAALFLKATSSLVGAGHGIEARHPDRRTDHEVELVVVVGRTASRVPREEALQYVAGYAVGLDMTIRGTEDRSFRKSLDTFSVVGPWLVTADEIAEPNALDLSLAINGDVRQQANTRQMILDVPALIELASRYYTLHPGDILFTGTPEGVSPVQPGDRIVATVQSVGTMTVDVRG
jgi:2-keto-4-pentenoate hydratase/2-oxohepta-3-ene-1,7-dioic acid hydratase in catechol pathway